MLAAAITTEIEPEPVHSQSCGSEQTGAAASHSSVDHADAGAGIASAAGHMAAPSSAVGAIATMASLPPSRYVAFTNCSSPRRKSGCSEAKALARQQGHMLSGVEFNQ